MDIMKLFSFFPRRVGIPSVVVNKPSQFLRYYNITRYSPRGSHTSMYDITEFPMIDKVVFDFDGKDLHSVKEEVTCLILDLEDKKLPYYVIFSGMKGFHIYILLEPQSYHIEVAKSILREFTSRYIYDFKHIDTTKAGALSTIRIPNSRNKIRFAVPLPYDFTKWSVDRILKYASSPKPFPRLNSDNFKPIGDLTNVRYVKLNNIDEEDEKYIKINNLPFHLLKDLLRPCTYHYSQTPKPTHIIRFNLVAELRELGLGMETVYKVIENLNWINFDPRTTKNYISYIYKNKLKPFSCQKTKPFVAEFCPNCSLRSGSNGDRGYDISDASDFTM